MNEENFSLNKFGILVLLKKHNNNIEEVIEEVEKIFDVKFSEDFKDTFSMEIKDLLELKKLIEYVDNFEITRNKDNELDIESDLFKSNKNKARKI